MFRTDLVGVTAAGRVREGSESLEVHLELGIEGEFSILVVAGNVVLVQSVHLASAGIHDVHFIVDLRQLLERRGPVHGIEEGLVSALHDLDLAEVLLLGSLALVSKELTHVLGKLSADSLFLVAEELLLLRKLLGISDLHLGLAGSRLVLSDALLGPSGVVLPVVVHHVHRVEIVSPGPEGVVAGKLLQSCHWEPSLNNLHHADCAILAG